MAIGLAGDSSGATDGYATGQLVLVELRVQSTFLQAIAAGQVSRALPPTFISCTPSVQPGITRSSGNTAGSPRS